MTSQYFSIAGKVALVTGGTEGLGLMIARGFVDAGAVTYIVSRDPARGAAAVEALGSDLARPLAADINTADGIGHIVDILRAREGRLDILVHNAGARRTVPIDEVSEEDWDVVMSVNLRSVFFLTQKLLPLLRAAARNGDTARIIAIGSIAGFRISRTEIYSYMAAKAGLHHLVRALARRLGGEGITVNAIAPGPFPSAMLDEIPGAAARAAADVPIGRLGTAGDIAGTAIYLASAAGGFVNGAVLPLDGGATLA